MSRPTQEALLHALGHLEQLAYRHDGRNNPNGAPDVFSLLDLLLWVDTERAHAKAAAAWPPGTDEGHTIGHYVSRPVEARLHFGNGTRPHLRDPLYRTLTATQRTMLHQLGAQVDDWMRLCGEAANWPTRTQDAG